MLVDQKSEKEKRARLVSTRPEPTINGNCISWKFIVGKLVCSHSLGLHQCRSLQLRNMGLSTSYPQGCLNLNEQLVGCLWNNGGHFIEMGHGETTADQNTMNQRQRPVILAKFNIDIKESELSQTFIKFATGVRYPHTRQDSKPPKPQGSQGQ